MRILIVIIFSPGDGSVVLTEIWAFDVGWK
jgi:hypothetical protein